MDVDDKGKKLLKGTLTYAVGDFGTKILSFLIVPLYTYYISTQDMGMYDLLVSTVGLLLPIMTLQISDSTYCWIISKKKEIQQCIKATYDILTVNSLLFLAAIAMINYFVHIPYCIYFTLLLICSAWYCSITKIIRGLSHQQLYASLGILFTAINLSLNVVQVILLKKGIESLLISSICAYIICTIIAFWKEPVLYSIRIFSFDKLLKREFVRFSVPLIPNYLNWWLINSSDSYIVSFVLGPSANGILSIAHKFPAMMQTIISLFNVAWQDLAVSDNKINKEYYTKIFDLLSRVLLGALLIVIPVTKIFVYSIMSNEYQSSSDYIPMYYLGAVYQGFSSFYGVGYLRGNKTSRAFSTSICAAVINFVVDVLLIKWIGIHAASLSTFVGFFIMWLIRERQNKEELGIVVNWKVVISMTLFDVLMALVSIKCGFIINICLAIIGCVCFLLLDWRYIIQIIRIVNNIIAQKKM